ncbi:MAG TPA: hypothetical protein VHE54_14260 [Puia sp.]|nr:hypothetical protein [Puia sp.]
MADMNRSAEQENWLGEPRKLPDMLNVLTILTFIGCGIGLIASIIYFFNAQSLYDSAVAAQDRMDRAPDWVKNLQGPDPIGTARRTLDNKLPILLLGLVATGLCLYGAILMRKWKKNGFTIYTIGELLPLLTGYLFIGASTLTGFRGVMAFFFTGLFIILYATQLKHLRK